MENVTLIFSKVLATSPLLGTQLPEHQDSFGTTCLAFIDGQILFQSASSLRQEEIIDSLQYVEFYITLNPLLKPSGVKQVMTWVQE